MRIIVGAIGAILVAAVAFACLVVVVGIILSFFGKDIYFEDLKDESNTESR